MLEKIEHCVLEGFEKAVIKKRNIKVKADLLEFTLFFIYEGIPYCVSYKLKF